MAEKSLSEIPSRTRELFERGNAALQRQNYDYALTMFQQALINEPGFYDCREALRAAQFNKSGAGGGKGFFKKVFGSASQSPMFAKAQVLLRTNPVEALQVCEQILSSDPANIAAHKLLAEAAQAAGLLRTAVLSLEIAFKHAPQDRDVALRLARGLNQAGRMARSEHIYSELLRAFPNDPNIAQALKNVSAQRTLTEGGYEAAEGGKASYRELLRNEDEAIALEQQQRQVKSEEVLNALIQEQEAQLAKEPKNLALLRTLAELFVQKNDFDRALEFYQRLLEAEGGSDPTVEKAIADTIAKRFDHAIAALDSSASNHAAEMARLEAEKRAFLLAECQKRSERYPHDLQISFELGQLYFESGQLTEAIREFQKAMNNPHKRIAAMSYLGQCFARRGMLDLAARRFQDAIKEKPAFDDEKKELTYLLGSVLEKAGQAEAAIEQFKQIYEVDIGYRDVAAKVDAYYAAGERK